MIQQDIQYGTHIDKDILHEVAAAYGKDNTRSYDTVDCKKI